MGEVRHAPGWPGIPARWTSSAKTGVGTALNPLSRVWFTISHGILNEVYYPRVDRACTRDMGMIVTDGAGFFSEEKRSAAHEVSWLADGVPGYRIVSRCQEGRYRLEKEIITDPLRDVVLQSTRLTPPSGQNGDLHLYVLLASHLANYGSGNTAWTGDYKGTPMLFAEREGNALALACSRPWVRMSVGFAGFSDGWQDLSRHGRMEWTFERAENGNVALTGEVDLPGTGGDFVVALAFGGNAAEAGQRALAALQERFEDTRRAYVQEWQEWQGRLGTAPADPGGRDLYRISASVLRTHEAPNFPGAVIASLSVPWGSSKGDDDLGGYHLVWPRDMVESAGALLAAGALADARRAVRYLATTQEADGHWSQNMWIDGTPYWRGIQMDETAFPILLVDLARREGALDDDEVRRLWPMVRRAAGFLACNGPVTPQDRWEEDPGYSPFTLAVEVAALLAAADLADSQGHGLAASVLRDTADAWNESIERWTYVTGTELAQRVGVEGYYVRIAPPESPDASSPSLGFVPIKNRPPAQSQEPAAEVLSPDALALVRLGLRSPHDPRMVDTIKVIDALLKVDTPNGPAWHRYNDDGYGEHEDGSPFDGTGTGRAWPLLTGERAHYELAAGRPEVARRLLHALEAFANEGGMLPEQVWDAPDIPDRELFFGGPSGSAMPLGWSHAEYIKLHRSLRDGRVFDMPPQPAERYLGRGAGTRRVIWSFQQKVRSLTAGTALRLTTRARATVRWSTDGWRTSRDTELADSELGLFLTDLPTEQLPVGASVVFTFLWPEVGRWENEDFQVVVQQ
ncbi:MAG: glucan 1,4-alpha-glucosidase [Acidobacteria bacterium]|jgi:glucoamylase|nr:glucan 1,4-alpha-glucosidase [Acidobacteriota bacterium]